MLPSAVFGIFAVEESADFLLIFGNININLTSRSIDTGPIKVAKCRLDSNGLGFLPIVYKTTR
jgi:hypothetical protein